MSAVFQEEYKKLNKAQKEAVEHMEGPVMVVAGPGTGKTQVLALRIANILKKTDIKADSVLCLTFTNSAVDAMKNRLHKYIGEEGEKVSVFTFHKFGMKILGDHYKVLGLKTSPKLLEDTEMAIFFDEVFARSDWQYLHPRSDRTRYFSDLKSLISILKRERITEKYFLAEIKKEIKFLQEDEDSVSTRGESKGQLKKEILKQIEGLERSLEIVKFMELYEEAKKERNVLDYDDVLSNLLNMVEESEEVVAEIREQYLYVLIDEHQDSSRVQNEFIKQVWGSVEKPDIFVVGDDRQLIYGFSGASIEYFSNFKKTFKGSKLITLTDNYRSTQVILDASHALLQSVMSDEKLISQSKEHHPIHLLETETAEEEIVSAAQDIQEKIKKGVNPNHCAILVPKNKQVRSALEVLHRFSIPISSLEALNLFDQEEALALLRVLKVINNGDDGPSFALSFFDKLSGIDPLLAHEFLAGHNMREFSLDAVLREKRTLFGETEVDNFVGKLSRWQKYSKNNSLQSLVEMLGKELLEDKNEVKLVPSSVIYKTILKLLSTELEKNPNLTLGEFILYLEKLEFYGEDIPLVAEEEEGVKVLTMHSSKGLEFDYVWIAHMDERSLNSGKGIGFTLPETIKEVVEERDIDAIKRKLYVAITRAKRFCTLSYARTSLSGAEQEVSRVIADLPEEILEKKVIPSDSSKEGKKKNTYRPELTKLVSKKYTDRYVSVSLLNNFFECSWKWYFRNLLQLPEAKNESLEFGSSVHCLIDKILKTGEIPNTEGMDKEVVNIISNWAKYRLPEIKLKRESEKSVSVKDKNFPHLSIYGKIDLMEFLDSKNVRVTDFKTGSVRKKSEIEKLDEEGRMGNSLRQLAMYSYLISESSKGGLDVRESRLEFVEAKDKKETFYDKIIQPKEVELLVQDIFDYDESVKSGKWMTRECHYNSYGKNTVCEYCKLAEIYLGPLSSQPR